MYLKTLFSQGQFYLMNLNKIIQLPEEKVINLLSVMFLNNPNYVDFDVTAFFILAWLNYYNGTLLYKFVT